MATLPPGPPQPGPPQPAPPSPPPPARALSLGDILVSFGALLVFSFSFAPFVQYDDEAQREVGAPTNVSLTFHAWSSEPFMVPLTTFVIVAILLAAGGAWTRFALRRNPNLLGFRLRQLEVGLTLFGFMVLFAMVISNKSYLFGYDRFVEAGFAPPGEGGLATAWGAVLMLVGALIALVGAVLNHLGLALSITAGMSQPAAPPYPGQPPYPPQPPPTQPPAGLPPPLPTEPPQSPTQPPPTQPFPTQPFPTQRDPFQTDPPRSA